MSNENVTGELLLKSEGKWKIEWTIKDIFSYTKEDEEFCSPYFIIPGSKWYLSIFPNGQTVNDSVGWISLYLCPGKDPIYPKNVKFNFGLKDVNGTIREESEDLGYEFIDGDGSGYRKFLDRAVLLEKKLILTPSDALTVICFFQINDNFDYTSRLVKLGKNFEDLLISKRFCDATLKVQQKEFPVHKCVLATRSTVFSAMFEVDMKEKTTGVVDIVDCNPEAFQDFLTYIYTGKSENFSKNVFEMYRIAHKYDVEELKSDCVVFIENNLSLENLYDAAILADQFDEQGVKIKTQDFFVKKFTEIVDTSEWKLFLKKNYRLANELLKSLAINIIKCTHCRKDGGSATSNSDLRIQ